MKYKHIIENAQLVGLLPVIFYHSLVCQNHLSQAKYWCTFRSSGIMIQLVFVR